MQRLALYLGMKEEGRRREAAFKDGRYVDLIEYGILAGEWQQQRAARRTSDNGRLTAEGDDIGPPD